MHELAQYIAKRGWHYGACLTKDFVVCDYFKRDGLALLTVKSKVFPPPNTHIVIYAGDVFDPQHDEPQPLSDYEVIEWWPVILWK